jgi:hypothetical protein
MAENVLMALEVDALTGETVERPLTAEEIADVEAIAAESQARIAQAKGEAE